MSCLAQTPVCSQRACALSARRLASLNLAPCPLQVQQAAHRKRRRRRAAVVLQAITPQDVQQANQTLAQYQLGKRSACGRWLIRSIREEDVLAVAQIQTEAFHLEHTLKPVGAAFKNFFRVSAQPPWHPKDGRRSRFFASMQAACKRQGCRRQNAVHSMKLVALTRSSKVHASRTPYQFIV